MNTVVFKKSLAVLLAIVLSVSFLGFRYATAEEESITIPVEVTVDAENKITEADLYDAIYQEVQKRGVIPTDFNEYFEIDLVTYKTLIKYPDGPVGNDRTLTLEKRTHSAYMCIGDVSYTGAINGLFSYKATTYNQCKINVTVKSASSAKPSSILVTSNQENAGSFELRKEDNTKVDVGNSTTEIANNTNYTLKITPNAEYAVESVVVSTKNSNGQDEVVSDNLTFSTDGTRAASISFTSGTNQSYTVNITYVKPSLNVNKFDTAPLFYLYGYDSAESKKEDILKTILQSTTPTDLSPVAVEYKAGEVDSVYQWKPLDFKNTEAVASLHEFGESENETIRLSYAGNNQYPSLVSNEVSIQITKKPLVTIDVQDSQVLQGESYSYKVSTDPVGVDYLVIAIDPASMRVQVEVPDSIKNKLGMYYEVLAMKTANGVSFDEFSTLISDLSNKLDELAKDPTTDTGVDTEALRKTIGFIKPYADAGNNLTIELDTKPTKVGKYFLWAITADSAFNTAFDMSATLTINSSSTNQYLQFNQTLDSTSELSVKEAAAFLFGGTLKNASKPQGSVITKYFQIDPTTYKETECSFDTVQITPGTYKETLEYSGSDYAPEKKIAHLYGS